MKKKSVTHSTPKFTSYKALNVKTMFTLELSQYCKSGAIFSSSEPVAARSDCLRLGNALVYASP